MRSRSHEISSQEFAMHCLLAVQQAPEGFALGDLVESLTARFGYSRANAYRRLRQAMDVLCVHYDKADPRRSARYAARHAEGVYRATVCRWPNGKPGRGGHRA